MTSARRALAIFSAAVSLVGCGSSRATIELPLEPIAYVDTLPINMPEEREVNQTVRLLRISVEGEIGHALSFRRLVGAQHEAINVTRFDDVVNSAWFEHRIGIGDMTPKEVARGPRTVGPDTSNTLTVVAGKLAGISPGFDIRDSNGTRFVIKFDPKGNLHLASAAGVISNLLFYAAGYHTPEDYIVLFDSAKLWLDPEAEIPTASGKKRKMTEQDILDVLSRTDPLPDGRFIALASKYVPGPVLGPFYFSSVRNDDANDYYHHQYRRELRGLYAVSAWTNHVDMRYENSMDVFIDPPGYVRHYLFDFAATLGSGTIRPHNPREGQEYNFAFWPTMARTVTLGFYKKGWEDVDFEQIHPSIGWIPVDGYDPGSWRPNWPNQAFRTVTPADGYWGAKLVASFSDEHVRAAVQEGALPVKEPEEALTQILIARRDKTVSYWYAKVTPIERVEASLAASSSPALEVSFEDLGLRAGLWTAEQTSYSWKFEDVYHQLEASADHSGEVGPRQTLRIDLDGLDFDAPGVSESEATAKLSVEVLRDAEPVGREAVVLLRWEGVGVGYRVVGLKH